MSGYDKPYARRIPSDRMVLAEVEHDDYLFFDRSKFVSSKLRYGPA
jgi:hypothetical protein